MNIYDLKEKLKSGPKWIQYRDPSHTGWHHVLNEFHESKKAVRQDFYISVVSHKIEALRTISSDDNMFSWIDYRVDEYVNIFESLPRVLEKHSIRYIFR